MRTSEFESEREEENLVGMGLSTYIIYFSFSLV